MKNFYTIVKFVPNKATSDSIAVGLLYFTNTDIQFYISDNKVKLLNKLINNKSINIKFIINQLKKKVNYLNSNNNNELNLEQKILTESFISYLHTYSNGLLTFSEPKYLSSKLNKDSFSNLVSYLFPEEKTVKIDNSISTNFERIKKTVNKKLIQRVENKVHTNFLIDKKKLDTIFFNYEIDCIGLNGAFIGAKTIDFNKSIQTIDKEVSHYFTLISSLSSKYNKKLENNKFFIISEEPQQITSKEHILWESIYKNQIIDILNPEQSNEVADLIESKNAKTFL